MDGKGCNEQCVTALTFQRTTVFIAGLEKRAWRRGPESNRCIKVLQTSALPTWLPRLGVRLLEKYRAGEAKVNDSASRYDWQQDVRRLRSIVIHRLPRGPQLGFVRHRSARIRIAVKPREIAARNLQPDRMALQEHVARDTSVNGDLVSLAWNRSRRFFQRLPIAEPQNAVGEYARGAVGKDVD
jgi:hypothetical protein